MARIIPVRVKTGLRAATENHNPLAMTARVRGSPSQVRTNPLVMSLDMAMAGNISKCSFEPRSCIIQPMVVAANWISSSQFQRWIKSTSDCSTPSTPRPLNFP